MLGLVLTFALQDAEEWVRRLAGEHHEEASRRLLQFGEEALEPLRTALDSDDIDVRERAAELVGRIRLGPRMSPRLEASLGRTFADLGHPDRERRIQGLRKVMESDGRMQAHSLLRFFLHDPSYEVAREALRFADRDSLNRSHIDGLLAMLRIVAVEGDGGAEAADLIRHLQPLLIPEDMGRLRPLLRSTPGATLAAQVLLFALGDRTTEADVLRALKGPPWKLRLALHGISRSPPEGASKALADAPLDSDDLRALAALTRARLGETVDDKELARWSSSRDPRIAGPARIALGVVKDDEGMKMVLKFDDFDEHLWISTLEMVATAGRAPIYEALLNRYPAGGFHIRAFQRLARSTQKLLLLGLYPIWSRTPPKATRGWDILYELAPCGETLKETAAKTLADPERSKDEHDAALLILRAPLTLDQEKVLRADLVSRISSDARGHSSLPPWLRLPALRDVARERIQNAVDPAWIGILGRHGTASDLDFLRSLDPGKNEAAARAILSARARLKDAQVVQPLLELLKDPKKAQGTLTDLDSLWSASLAERLRECFAGEAYRSVRDWILVLFHHARDTSLVPAYRSLMTEKEFRIRIQAAEMAGEWRDGDARDLLRELSADPDARVRLHAFESLAKLGDQGIEPDVLKLLLEDKDLGSSAIRILGFIASPSAVRTLLRIALHDSPHEQGEALKALLSADAPNARDPARLILETRRGDVGNALSALQRFGQPEDATLLLPLASEGLVGALLALDAVLNKAHYPSGSARKSWSVKAPLDTLASKCGETYGVRITLSDELSSLLPYRWEPALWGDLDLKAALHLLTYAVQAAPLADERGIRLVTVSEAVRYWERRK